MGASGCMRTVGDEGRTSGSGAWSESSGVGRRSGPGSLLAVDFNASDERERTPLRRWGQQPPPEDRLPGDEGRCPVERALRRPTSFAQPMQSTIGLATWREVGIASSCERAPVEATGSAAARTREEMPACRRSSCGPHPQSRKSCGRVERPASTAAVAVGSDHSTPPVHRETAASGFIQALVPVASPDG